MILSKELIYKYALTIKVKKKINSYNGFSIIVYNIEFVIKLINVFSIVIYNIEIILNQINVFSIIVHHIELLILVLKLVTYFYLLKSFFCHVFLKEKFVCRKDIKKLI